LDNIFQNLYCLRLIWWQQGVKAIQGLHKYGLGVEVVSFRGHLDRLLGNSKETIHIMGLPKGHPYLGLAKKAIITTGLFLVVSPNGSCKGSSTII
jgi:hypothetical protein